MKRKYTKNNGIPKLYRGYILRARANFYTRDIHFPKKIHGFSEGRVYTYETSNGDIAFTARPKQKGSWVITLGLATSYRKIRNMWKKKEG